MFRGKESSNRIELSRLVQEFWCFRLPVALGVGVGGWGWGWLGGAPPHVHVGVGGWGWGMVGGCPHTCAHAHACMHVHAHTCARGKHDNFMQMAAPIGEIPGIPYDVICACACLHMHACACMCTCVGGTLLPLPTHIHPPTHPPGGGPPESVKIQ